MSNINMAAAAKRQQRITENEILSLQPDVGFNNICKLAAGIAGVENAGISFVGNEVFTIAQTGNLRISDKLLQVSISELEQTDVFLLKDATEYGIFLAAVPIKTRANEVIGLITVYSDQTFLSIDNKIDVLKSLSILITEKLATRLAIRHTMRAQDDRLHVLIHDLKNPMTAVSLQSELIGRIPNIDEKAALIAGKINLQAKKIVDHLNDILSSARKEKGSFKPQKEKLDLTAILNAVVAKLDYELIRKNIKAHIDIDGSLEIFGDQEKLEIVFYQLLQNAIKFSDSGEIRISHQDGENEITIAVKDNGAGLSAADLDNLFVKFASLSSKSTNNEYSNGLGLTLAKMYIDIHKGKLWATSEGINQGTTFFVQLPVK